MPSKRTVTVYEPTKGRSRDEHWETLETIFGPCRTKVERDARNAACAHFRDGGVSPEEMRRAAANWPNVMSDAVITPFGLAKYLGMLLEGPQVNGRSKGTTVGLHQQATQRATLRLSPEDELAAARRGR